MASNSVTIIIVFRLRAKSEHVLPSKSGDGRVGEVLPNEARWFNAQNYTMSEYVWMDRLGYVSMMMRASA